MSMFIFPALRYRRINIIHEQKRIKRTDIQIIVPCGI